MIAEYRKDFNRRFSAEAFQRYLRLVEERSGAPVQFRCSETPCFFPENLLEEMMTAGADLTTQLVSNPRYLEAADAVIPVSFRVPAPSDRPLFIQADFGIVAGPDGTWNPRLVEIQGFPSLYGLQNVFSDSYRDAFELDPHLLSLPRGLDATTYRKLLTEAIVGDHDPGEVVLLELDPRNQKTLPDFLVTEKLCGIHTVDIRHVIKNGRRLAYMRDGSMVPIRRIYNRAIADELIRKQVQIPFRFDEDLDVEWAGNPNWFFKISKFSLPWLRHATVPRSWFLSDLEPRTELPLPPEKLVLKPLFSFAGAGVQIAPALEQILAIPEEQRGDFLLQERMEFAGTIQTPPGMAKAEIRIMYLWLDKIVPVNFIVRMGRGSMMGVDQNRNIEWVGASASFYPK